MFGPPVYVRRAIVHNVHVVARLAAAGAVFVDELDDVPRGASWSSAHTGSRRRCASWPARGPPSRRRNMSAGREGPRRGEPISSCRVRRGAHRTRWTRRGGRHARAGRRRPARRRRADVSGVRVSSPDRVACVTQTTLRDQEVEPVIDALRNRFPTLERPAAADICYATRNRQERSRARAARRPGDRRRRPTSSNSRHLREVAAATCDRSYLVGSAAEIESRGCPVRRWSACPQVHPRPTTCLGGRRSPMPRWRRPRSTSTCRSKSPTPPPALAAITV